ncbi:MAG: hypothetical protein ACR2QH_15420 [Geminicoccaceae bacterium]
MRRRLLDVALFCVLCLSLFPAKADQTDRYDPRLLAEDELYIREGAITKFDTCLAVADDASAFTFWQSSHLLIKNIRDSNEADRAGKLSALPPHLKRWPGFGTVYTCTAIVEGWHSPNRVLKMGAKLQPKIGPGDGRYLHGTVVVDLGIDQDEVLDDPEVERGRIKALSLVRILTSPLLLPPRAFGGVVIRNTVVDGVLLFHNVHLSIPLSFANVQFRGSSYNKDVFGEDVEDPIKDTAVAFVNSRFEDRIQVSASQLCGHVRIIESRLAETLKFLQVEQRDIECNLLDPSKVYFVRINSSTFGQSLSTVRSKFGKMDIIGSDIHEFISSRSNFGHIIRILESDMGSLQIDCSILAKEVNFWNNKVEKDFYIRGNHHKRRFSDISCKNWWNKNNQKYDTSISISSNRIGGGLGLYGLDGTRTNSPIDLSSNRVGNGSRIGVPSPGDGRSVWPGEINLEGSSYEGTIKINSAEKITKVTDSAIKQYCGPPKTGQQPTTINFKAARIRTLRWNMPLDCNHRWMGYGFAYDLWLPGKNTLKSMGRQDEDHDNADASRPQPPDDHEALMKWRFSLASYEASSLNTMSNYLAGKASYVASRNILLEAKRLNYAPDCSPDTTAPKCIQQDSFRQGNLRASLWAAFAGDADSANRNTNGSGDPEGPSRWDQSWRATMLILLWPGGYGAKPERALLLLLGAMFAFFLLYVSYSLVLRWQLSIVPSYNMRLKKHLHEPDPDRTIAADHRSSARQSSSFDHDTSPSGMGNPAGIIQQIVVALRHVRRRLDEFWHEPKMIFASRADEILRDHRSHPFIHDREKSAIKSLMDKWPKKDAWKKLGKDEKLDEVQQTLLADLRSCEKATSGRRLVDLKSMRRKLELFGTTEKLGFSFFDRGKSPKRFTHWRYSIDTMLPVIDLHAYGNYYAESGWIRMFSVIQHVLGWWWLTVFIASAAIL